jgi:hypothetical protein
MKNPISIFLKNNGTASETVKKLSLWDESLTVDENAKRLAITTIYAYVLSRRYKLPFDGMYRKL